MKECYFTTGKVLNQIILSLVDNIIVIQEDLKNIMKQEKTMN